MSVAIVGKLGAAPLDASFGPADRHVRSAEHALLAAGPQALHRLRARREF
jgi:hypothetical protein